MREAALRWMLNYIKYDYYYFVYMAYTFAAKKKKILGVSLSGEVGISYLGWSIKGPSKIGIVCERSLHTFYGAGYVDMGQWDDLD